MQWAPRTNGPAKRHRLQDEKVARLAAVDQKMSLKRRTGNIPGRLAIDCQPVLILLAHCLTAQRETRQRRSPFVLADRAAVGAQPRCQDGLVPWQSGFLPS